MVEIWPHHLTFLMALVIILFISFLTRLLFLSPPAPQHVNSIRTGTYLSCSLLCSHHLEQCLAHKRQSTNIQWGEKIHNHALSYLRTCTIMTTLKFVFTWAYSLGIIYNNNKLLPCHKTLSMLKFYHLNILCVSKYSNCNDTIIWLVSISENKNFYNSLSYPKYLEWYTVQSRYSNTCWTNEF